MINREWKSVTVISFSEAVDERYQRRAVRSGERVIEAVVKIYAQKPSDDPRYAEVELIALTKDQDVTTNDQIIIDSEKYDILYLVPLSRINQLFLRKRS